MKTCLPYPSHLVLGDVKSFLVDCWLNQFSILEMRGQEAEMQRQNLQMHPDRFREFSAITYEGDNGECLEMVAMLLIALMHVEFVGLSSESQT